MLAQLGYGLGLGSAGLHFHYLLNPGSSYRSHTLFTISKCVPILLLAHQVHRSKDQKALRHKTAAIATGLTLSALGDAFLAVEDLHPSLFTAGLASFLAAHISYIVGFKSPRSKHWGWTLATAVGLSGSIAALIVPSTPWDLKAPVAVYIGVLGSVIWNSLDAAVADTRRSGLKRWSGVIGALLFAASDSILAYDKFKHPFATSALYVMGTYYSSQYFIAQYAVNRKSDE
ncbi:YhhN-like protein [Polychytrium aggregatum]|uniref:YhhN-like protein n=1 Tax=Polychytrium aggregatum TaxID=110093 RepID=UPI0022FE140E|nr:YhhN-like protein [Polychytrium aggregatum]KAI9206955.1 YhhN-like protein [Polychytrium aggregatum]